MKTKKKKTRLQQMTTPQVYKLLMNTYKQIKETHNINDIQLFKSFFARMMEAQNEMDSQGKPLWTSIDNYTLTILGKTEEKIMHNVLNLTSDITIAQPFDYNKKLHYKKIL